MQIGRGWLPPVVSEREAGRIHNPTPVSRPPLCRKTMMAKRNDDEELKPGAIWGGWWFWEPPLGKTKESPADTHKRIAPQHAEHQGGQT